MFEEEYIKEREVVEEGYVSRAMVIRARRDGLTFYRIGAYVCYKPQDLENWFCKPRSMRKAAADGDGLAHQALLQADGDGLAHQGRLQAALLMEGRSRRRRS